MFIVIHIPLDFVVRKKNAYGKGGGGKKIYFSEKYTPLHSPVTCQGANSSHPNEDNKHRTFSNTELSSNKQHKVFD